MNERWHMFRFTCKNPWVRQPQNEEALSSLAEFWWRVEISGVKRKTPHQDAFFTPTGRHQPRHSPFQTHRDVSASYRFLSNYVILSSFHFLLLFLISFPIAVHIALPCYKPQHHSILGNRHIHTQIYTHNWVYMLFAYNSNILRGIWQMLITPAIIFTPSATSAHHSFKLSLLQGTSYIVSQKETLLSRRSLNQ